jgi:predicted ester cyclase
MGEAAEVMRRELRAVNERDTKTISASFSPECIKLVPGARLQGGEQVVAWLGALWEAFPDFKITVTNVIEEGTSATVGGTASGTHLGTLRTASGDIPPTGGHAELSFCETAEVQEGVILSARMYYDRLDLLEQLGLVPAPANA